MIWDGLDYAGPSQCNSIEIGGSAYRREVIPIRVTVNRGAINRETVRDAFTALLSTALVGTGLPAQAVYGYQVGDFGSQSPVVVVSDAGSMRSVMTGLGSRAEFLFNIFVFVLYTDGSSWNEDDAEDALDAIEKIIADVLDANQHYS